MLWMTLLVFVSVAAFSIGAAMLASSWRGRAIDRLTGRQRVAAVVPSPSMAWQELVSRIGTLVPASPTSAPLLKQRLMRAGWRNPGAARAFNGARTVSTVLFTCAAIVFAGRPGADRDYFFLTVAGGAVLGYMLPGQLLLWKIGRRKHAIERGLPHALDLMVVCVESGLGLDQTTVQVARELQVAYPEISDEFAVMNLELRAGKRRAEALHNLADRTGVADLRKLVAVLVQTDRFGTSIAQTLRGHSEYMRVMARQRAEEKAAKLAVKLVFPIFFCILPSLFVVTVGPVLTRLIRDLLPMIDQM
jgi:tight adherence protein C